MDISMLTTAFQAAPSMLDFLTGGWASFTVPADFIHFSLIYDFVRHEIKVLGFTLMARASYFASLVALALVTMWVFYQGIRIFAGKGDSMMALVLNASRVAFIVTAAISMGVSGSAMYDTVGVRLPGVITGYVTDSADTVEEQIDESLFAMTVAMKSISALNVATDETIEDDKNRAMYMVAVGTAGPAVTAGTLLLFYQAGLALFIGLGPIFILCLIFDQTKSLFTRWLMYGIGTMFSMAVLAAMTSIALKAVIAIAAAHWATAIVNFLGFNVASGITEAAMQQGGVGLMLSLLILTVPTMAAQFFQGTLGQFASYAQVSGAGTGRSAKEEMLHQRTQQNEWNRNFGGGSGSSAPNPGTRTGAESGGVSVGRPPNHPGYGQRNAS